MILCTHLHVHRYKLRWNTIRKYVCLCLCVCGWCSLLRKIKSDYEWQAKSNTSPFLCCGSKRWHHVLQNKNLYKCGTMHTKINSARAKWPPLVTSAYDLVVIYNIGHLEKLLSVLNYTLWMMQPMSACYDTSETPRSLKILMVMSKAVQSSLRYIWGEILAFSRSLGSRIMLSAVHYFVSSEAPLK